MSPHETCKLCSTPISNENFQVIEGTTKDILNFLLLSLDFNENVVHVMCKTCFEKIMEAFEFKSTCISTDATIIPNIDLKTLTRLDLGQIYWKERGQDYTIISSREQQICRLCMQLAGNNFFSLQEMNKDMLQKFLPEINVDVKGDPIVCKSCFGLFHSISKFLQNCLDVNASITHSDLSREDSQGVDSSFDSCTQKDTKLGNVKLECTENEEMTIKTEEIQIKSEVDETYGDQSTFSAEENGSVVMDVEKQGMEICNKRNSVGKFKLEKSSAHHQEPKLEYENSSKVRLSKYKNRVYESNSRRSFRAQYKTENKIFICYTCGFKTMRKKNLYRHFVKHKNASEVKTFDCKFCNFKSRYGTSLFQHIRWKHTKFYEVRMYKCNSCDFKTKYSNSFHYHELQHKNPSEVQQYKCDICDYQTNYKPNLKRHLITHEHPAGKRIFKCDNCDLETNYKVALQRHNRSKHSSDVRNYKCDTCE